MLNIYLKNDYLQIIISSLGAEMQSIRTRAEQIEYLWQGDPDVLDMRSPVLFPLIGRPRNGRYKLGGKYYNMELHGFAREMEFGLLSQADDSAVFRINETEETKKIYPFDFTLDIKYRLELNSISTCYRVMNTGSTTMWFSLGTHSGFRCPMEEGEAYTDYFIEFEVEEKVERRFIENFMLNGKRQLLLDNSRILPVNSALFKDKGLITDSLKSDRVSLKNKNNSRAVSVEFKGFPYFTIWSNREEGRVVCLEPWYGLPPAMDEELDLSRYEGILKLEPGKEFSCEYKIVIE